jgi:type I restriction enzyme S subunit
VSDPREVVREMTANNVAWTPLRDVGTWYGGGTPSKSVREYWENGDIPWLSPKDMSADILTATEDHIAAKALEKSTVRLVPAGSIAFVVRSNVLRRRLPIALVPFAATLNQDMRAVVPRDGIVVEYLAQVCQARANAILAIAGRADGSMAAIQSKALLDFEVPIPPVAAQRAIVTVLDRYSYLQAELEAELESELKARRQQYAYRRDSILTFSRERERESPVAPDERSRNV